MAAVSSIRSKEGTRKAELWQGTQERWTTPFVSARKRPCGRIGTFASSRARQDQPPGGVQQYPDAERDRRLLPPVADRNPTENGYAESSAPLLENGHDIGLTIAANAADELADNEAAYRVER